MKKIIISFVFLFLYSNFLFSNNVIYAIDKKILAVSVAVEGFILVEVNNLKARVFNVSNGIWDEKFIYLRIPVSQYEDIRAVNKAFSSDSSVGVVYNNGNGYEAGTWPCGQLKPNSFDEEGNDACAYLNAYRVFIR